MGSGEGRRKENSTNIDFCNIDTQAVITVYVPATTVSGGKWRETGV